MRRTSALRANGTSLEPIDRWRKPMPLPGPVNAGIRRSLALAALHGCPAIRSFDRYFRHRGL